MLGGRGLPDRLDHVHGPHLPPGAAALRAAGARLHALEDYSKDLTLESAARGWGLPISVTPYQVDERFVMGKPLKLAGLEISLAHIPGHATDSVTFHLVDHGVVFSGDTLFAGSIGRTDLPGGSTDQLLDGIARHLMTLPPQTRILPGHGPGTTVGEEAVGNPYLD